MLVGMAIVAMLCPIAARCVREWQEREKSAMRLPLCGDIGDFGSVVIHFDRQAAARK